MEDAKGSPLQLNKKPSLRDVSSALFLQAAQAFPTRNSKPPPPPSQPQSPLPPPPTSQPSSFSTTSAERTAPNYKARSRSTMPALDPVFERDTARMAATKKQQQTRSQPQQLSKSTSQYFHAALHERSGDVAGDFVRGVAMVMAELKTNVKIDDEFAFINDFAQHLAKRYNRPVESIIVSLDHGKCMLFGGTMDYAYTMTISALPLEVQKVTNKRNTAVIQRYMETALGVSSTRGYIRFIPMSEECVGWGGKTVFGRIGDAGGQTGHDSDESRTHDRRVLKSLSLRSKNAPSEATPPSTPLKSHNSVSRSSSTSPSSAEKVNAVMANGRGLRKKKSLMATLFRTSKYESDIPAIPQEADD